MKLDRAEYAASGRIVVPGVVNKETLTQLSRYVGSDRGSRRMTTELGHPILGRLLDGLAPVVQALSPKAKAVRGTVFVKDGAANWGVPWHQDRVVAVRRRLPMPGFSCWSEKSGYWHVEPPAALSAQCLFVRIPLDDENAAVGGLQIARGSHHQGYVASREAARIAERCELETVSVEAGDAVLCHGLLLHRSSAAEEPMVRRVLRIDFCDPDLLPKPLEWASPAAYHP